MKFKNKETNTIVEITDKERIAKFQGYPDKFEEIKEVRQKPKKDEE